jgi:hypothetical protein
MTDQPENVGAEPEQPKGRARIKIPKIDFKLSRGIKLAVLIVGLIVLAFNIIFVYVHPNEFGI